MKNLLNSLLQHKLLLLSVVANLCLLFACFFLYNQARETYGHYRYFRALPIGISQATDATPTDNSIVLFGDSRIETWYPDPYSDKYTFINAGVTGETTTEMQRRFERDVVRLNPDYVLIQAGMNDMTLSVTKNVKDSAQYVDTMHENLHYFISTLESQDIDVIVTSIIPNKHLNIVRKQFWHNTLSDDVKDANSRLKQTALSLGADWLDLDPLYLDSDGNPVNTLFFDTLHINYQGYDVLNSTLKDYVDNLSPEN